MGFLSKIGSFFSDGFQELKKVRWPNRKELTNYTLVVIATVALIAVFFSIVDLGISELLRLIFR